MGNSNQTRLKYRKETAFAEAVAAALSTATLTLTGAVANDQTVTINGRVYTFKTGALAGADAVAVGRSPAESIRNLVAAINKEDDPNHNAATAHTTVWAEVHDTNAQAMVVYARTHGANAYAVAETIANGSWSAANMSGGVAAAALALKELRFVSHSLRHANNLSPSEEVTYDRGQSEIVKVGISGAGSLKAEAHYGDYQDFIDAAIQGTPAEVNAANIQDAACDSVAQTITLTDAAIGGPVPLALKQARLIKVAGFVNAGNNGIKRVIGVTATPGPGTVTFYLAPGSIVATENLVDTVTFTARHVRNGLVVPSFLFEDFALDAGSYRILQGMCVDEWMISSANQEKLMWDFNFLGYGGFERPDTVSSNSTDPSANPVIECGVGTTAFKWGEREAHAPVRSMELSVKNMLRDRFAIAREGTHKPGFGSCALTGKLEIYFTNRLLLRDYLRNKAGSLWNVSKDLDGRHISIYLPKVTPLGDLPENPGKDNDIFYQMNFQGQRFLDTLPATMQAATPNQWYSVQVDTLAP